MDDLDFMDVDWFTDDDGSDVMPDELVEETQVLGLDTYVERSRNYWQQIPLPPDISLDGTNLLANLSDETLLTMSPSLIAHVQRSEASGGLQVVSPRTVTLGGLAARTGHTKRTTDMLLVGSGASKNTKWPTVRGTVPEHLFWGEPIDSYPSDPAPRARTVSTGLVPSSRLISDPVTKAFLTGRALVDLQRRSDVAGSAEALTSLLAASWGIDKASYEDFAEASLAPSGPLLRYAIRADSVYPAINAPVHARKCISVGANTAGRQLYGEHAAIDWRRLRVLAEAVFYQSSRLEGYTMSQMALQLPPGNPRAPPNRAGVLQMRPLPGSVWSFEPATFRLDIDTSNAAVSGVRVPARIRAAVDRYHEEVRPIAEAAAAGVSMSFNSTQALTMKSEAGESIISGFKTLLGTHTAFSARGKTSMSAVRGYVYEALADAADLASVRSLWLARYMHETTEALNLTHLMDLVTTRHVSARMTNVTTDLRARLGVEAGRRNSDLLEWWSNLAAQLPVQISTMAEGSGAWSMAIAHLLLHPPSSKWIGLTRAMSAKSHASMARSHLRDVRLPAAIGSADRTYQAGLAVSKQLGESYGAYYMAMFDVACVMSARLDRAGNKHGAEKVMLAGLMWDIRAKVASTTSLVKVDDASKGTIRTKHGSYKLTTSPYYAYKRWQKALNDSTIVKKDVKNLFPHHVEGKVDDVMEQVQVPIFGVAVGSKSRLYRYAQSPGQLATDMRKTMMEIGADVFETMKYYDNEGFIEADVRSDVLPEVPLSSSFTVDVERFRPAIGSYWDLIAGMEPLEAQDIVDTVLRMDEADSNDIESSDYASLDDLRARVWGTREADLAAASSARDAVV